MNGYLTDWLVKEHVAELRAQAARRHWRVDVKRARAEIGTVVETVDQGGASATAGRSTETAVYCHRAAAPARQSTSV